VETKIPIRFFVITFLWSWVIWGGAILIGQSNSQESIFETPGIVLLIMILGTFGPAIGAIISKYSIEGKDAVKIFLKSFLSLKFGWKVWTLIFLVLGGACFIAWIIPEFLGEDRLPMYLPSAYVFLPYLLMMVFFGGGQEEIGWRGYISPYLERKYGLIVGGLILGIVWAAWHLPLWFIPGTSQIYMNFFGFMLGTIGYSYFLSWVIAVSGNRLMSGLIAHGTANAFAALFPWLIMADDVKQTRFWIYLVFILIIGIIIVAARTYKSKKIGT